MTSVSRVAYFSILAFPVLLISLKPIAIILFVLLSLSGLYISIVKRLNPFAVEETKLFSYITVGYFSVMALSVAFSHEPTNDWRHLSRIAYFLFAPFVAIAIRQADVSLEKLIQSFKIGIILAGLIVLVQLLLLGQTGRLSGMYNPNTFGDIAVIMLYLSLSSITEEKKVAFWMSCAALFFGVSAVVQSGSRGSMLALLLLLPVYVWLQYRRQRTLSKKIWLTALSILMVFLLNLSFSHTSGQRILHSGVEMQKSTSNVGQRIAMYRAGWKAFLDAPIFGYGYRNCNSVASRYISDKKVSQKISKYTHLHNEIITHMVNAGLIGVWAYLSIILLPAFIFLKAVKVSHVTYVGTVLTIGYLILGLTHGMFGYAYEGALFIVALAYAFMGRFKERDSGE